MVGKHPGINCTWYLNFSFFGTYIFPFFSTNSPFIHHSFPCIAFIFAFFISSTILTTSSSFFLAFFKFFYIISTLGPSITTSSNLYSQLSFIIIWLSLSFSISTFQSSLLLSLSAFSILVPGTYFKVKSNLDKYKAHHVYLWFNFCTFMKYSKFLWSVQISNLDCAPSSKCVIAQGCGQTLGLELEQSKNIVVVFY